MAFFQPQLIQLTNTILFIVAQYTYAQVELADNTFSQRQVNIFVHIGILNAIHMPVML